MRVPKKRAITIVLAMVMLMATYSLSFMFMLKQGTISYHGRNGFGSVRIYWFSRNSSVNSILAKLYFMPIRKIMNCRDYTTFHSDVEIQEWSEFGGNVFLDDYDHLSSPEKFPGWWNEGAEYKNSMHIPQCGWVAPIGSLWSLPVCLSTRGLP